MKYIKLFQTIADKQAAELDYPNTNYVVENSKASIERGEPIETRLIAVYNVTSTTEPTRILYMADNLTSMEVDGVQQPSVSTGFTFSTTGEHTVKYEINSNWNGYGAFWNCQEVKSVIIPSGVTSVGAHAFRYCSGLTSVTIPDSVTTIGEMAFSQCTGLTNATIPEGVTNIGEGAFQICYSLTGNITIPSGVTVLNDNVFAGCSGLTSLTISENVTSIGERTFQACTVLTSITIPDSVTSIGYDAFSLCLHLTSITVNATTPPTLGIQAFRDTNDCPIYVPSASLNDYLSAWSAYASRIQAIQ